MVRNYIIALLLAYAGVSVTLPAWARGAHVPNIIFAPHHATYEISLLQNRTGSNVTTADGTITYTLRDGCEGWTIDQTLDINLLYNQGEQTHLVVSNSSWEAKDGSRYNFATRTMNNGAVTDVYRGMAERDSTGGMARYAMPAGKSMKLTAGTVFPNQHLLTVLQQAVITQGGTALPPRMLYDGTDEQPLSEVSGFIGKAMPAFDVAAKAAAIEPRLLAGTAWPIQFAYYNMPDTLTNPSTQRDDSNETTPTGTPDYELTLDLQANGVARKMRMDYGSFALSGTLATLKALPAESDCAKR